MLITNAFLAVKAEIIQNAEVNYGLASVVEKEFAGKKVPQI